MELPIESRRMTGSEDPITVWDARRLTLIRSNPMSMYLYQAIDGMGHESKVAQSINAVLTSVERLKANPQHRLYLMCAERKCIGIIKVGSKKLFIRRPNGNLVEMDPLCVLDFYVHESEQRHGYGRVLFEHMMQQERVDPRHLAIDRPSPKFLGFLKKHYHLADYVPQSNNFVVFNQYFEVPSSCVPAGNSAAPSTVSPSTTAPLASAPHALPSNASLNISRAVAAHTVPAHLLVAGSAPCSTFGNPISSNLQTGLGMAASALGPAKGFGSAGSVPLGAQPQLQRVGSRELLSTSGRGQAIRRTSPTRSGVQGYNIISLKEERPSAQSFTNGSSYR